LSYALKFFKGTNQQRAITFLDEGRIRILVHYTALCQASCLRYSYCYIWIKNYLIQLHCHVLFNVCM